MTDKEIQTNHVKISVDGLDIDTYLAAPTIDGTYPGIVVLQEVFGVNSHIRDITERIAKLGYVAIAPALFQRLAPGFETGYTPEELEVGRKYAWEQTKASELLSDIQAAIDYLKALPQVKPNAIGCIGFCFGGHVAYLAGTLPDIKATAAFYGAGIPNRTPGGGSPTLSRTSEISGTIYAFFGLEDGSIPTEHINQIEAELTKYHISHKIFRYHGAGHGFFCDRRASYNPEATADAWEQVKQLFETL
ncbi:dienelactone hydrolase family protein [Chroococcidiopsis sp. FACHB-1243]|uniref:dienelactone hydrolase family protein n=1 Tax=Chroococcidiopsis sp. [FACHB-1243] TaxID=2692781 RepID=UPI0017873915|nr:dienelactone hydrolase family protein [Chroococcidiopsis sp. [FACHB-1243]]MBD2304540.1 dienelactone hydrolase family protein [Chroococcidiopsis sp. [FACHB-1243]]